jgi:transcriptional regulator with XRE-family HTH domain
MTQTSLGHKLRLLRAERGLTLREAASLSGVAKETISDIERGIRHPHDVTVAKLARAYDVPIEDLLEEPVLAAPKASAPPSEATTGPPRVGKERLQEHFEDVLQDEVDYLNRMIADFWRLANPEEKPEAHFVPDDIDSDRVWQFLEHAFSASNVFEPDEIERIKRGAVRKAALAR